MVHSVRKSLKEYGDQLDASEKTRIEEATTAAEESLKSDDRKVIEAKTQALTEAAQKLGEKIYASQQAQAGAASGAEAAASGGAGAGAKADDSDVVDAEFTEVKDKK